MNEGLSSLDSVNRFALGFYKDVAEIYDCLTRVKNVETNPTGFNLLDAPTRRTSAVYGVVGMKGPELRSFRRFPLGRLLFEVFHVAARSALTAPEMVSSAARS